MYSISSLNTLTNIQLNQSIYYNTLPAICQPANTPILVSFDYLNQKNIGTATNTTTVTNPTPNSIVISNTVAKFGGSSLQLTLTNATLTNSFAINSFVFPANGFSMACWFNYTSIPTSGGVLFLSDGISAYGRNHAVGFYFTNSTTLRVAVGWQPTTFNNLFQDIPIVNIGGANNWYHIGMSISSAGVVTLVINGSQVTWTAGNCLYGSGWLAGQMTRFCLGTSNYKFPGGINVYIDQLRLYNSVLTVNDFQTIYNNGC